MAREGTDEDLPTSHIIYHEEDNNGNVRARVLNLGPAFPPRTIPPNITICSSSKGILLLLAPLTGNYYLYNPFNENSMKPLPTPPRPPTDPYNACFDIVAVGESTVDVVLLKGRPYNDEHCYEAHVFSTDLDCWFTMSVGNFGKNLILPNSGVSCGRNVYFLVDSDSVLKIDIVKRQRTLFHLPHYDFDADDKRKVQLGRIGGMLGLMIANESKLLMMVYLLNQRDSSYHWLNLCSVKVVLEHDCDDVSIIQEEEEEEEEEERGLMRRITCREMPRPMRFESFKMQVPLWVDRKIVMLESTGNGVVLPRIFDGLMLPSCITHGLPHVMSKTRLHSVS